MVLKWIGASRDSDDVSDLIARKKYGRAIEVLRAQFKQRPPGVQTRLQFVDVLILAGRGREAVPILVGLAEELAADGFSSKAIALLKRVEKIEPGRDDVEALMGQLVMDRPPRERSHVPSLGAEARESASQSGFDVEEIDEGELVEPATGETSAVEAPVETTGEGVSAGVASLTERDAGEGPASEEPPPAAEPGEVKSQIRGAFRKFLEGLDEEGAPREPDEAPAEDEVGPPSPQAEAETPASAAEAPVEPARPEKRRRGGFLRRLFGGEEEEPEARREEAVRTEQVAGGGAEEEPPLTTGEIEALAETSSAAEVEVEPDAPPLTTGEIEALAETSSAAEVEVEPDAPPLTAGEIEALAETSSAAEVEVEPDAPPLTTGEIEALAETSSAAEVEVEPDAPPLTTGEIEALAETSSAAEVEAELEAPALTTVEAGAETGAEPGSETDEPAAAALAPELARETAATAGLQPEPAPDDEPSVAERPEAYLRQLLATPPDSTLDEAGFQDQVLDLIEEVLQQPVPAAAPPAPEPPSAPPAGTGAAEPAAAAPVRTRGVAESAQQLAANPLLRELSEEERLAVVRGMRLHTYEAGDVVATEGEPGDSVFTVILGAIRVFVKNPAGHNFEMGVLREGEFFGEISSLSGRPRTSTVVATTHTELLELDKDTVERIARKHPRVQEILENAYLQRASSPEAAAIRAVPVDPASRQRAIEVLEAYFGESRWDPRMRLRLADLLVRTGKEDDAVPLLVGLAEDLERAGYPEKAVAILKKIERIRRRNIEEVNLAPLSRKGKPGAKAAKKPRHREAAAAQPLPTRRRAATQAHFENWIVDVVRDAVKPAAEATAPVLDKEGPVYARGLRASPLFEGLGEAALLAVIRELRLLSFDPGDVILTEGEPGQSLFILTAGSVRVYIRNAAGRNVFLTELREGAFFGEMAVVSGKPRTATITARERCELLELEKGALDGIAERFPRVREVIEDAYISRATSPQAASIRTRTTRA